MITDVNVEKLAELIKERDQLRADLAALEERHSIQLAAISTASIQNTETTKKDRITADNPYFTTAYADTCRAVDREMQLRAELKRVWEALGITTYEQAQPFPVWEHVAKIKADLAALQTKLEQAEKGIRDSIMILANYHDSSMAISHVRDRLKASIKNETQTNI